MESERENINYPSGRPPDNIECSVESKSKNRKHWRVSSVATSARVGAHDSLPNVAALPDEVSASAALHTYGMWVSLCFGLLASCSAAAACRSLCLAAPQGKHKVREHETGIGEGGDRDRSRNPGGDCLNGTEQSGAESCRQQSDSDAGGSSGIECPGVPDMRMLRPTRKNYSTRRSPYVHLISWHILRQLS